MLKLLLFVSICFADSGYVSQDTNNNDLIKKTWTFKQTLAATDTAAVKETNGVYTFANAQYSKGGPNEYVPETDINYEKGHKLLIKNDNKKPVGLFFLTKNPEDTTGEITFEVRPNNETFTNYFIHDKDNKDDTYLDTELKKEITVKFFEKTGTEPTSYFNFDNDQDRKNNLKRYNVTLYYEVKGDKPDFTKYQNMTIGTSAEVKIKSLKFSKTGLRFNNLKTNIYEQGDAMKYSFRIDPTTNCTMSKETGPNGVYFMTCAEDHLCKAADHKQLSSNNSTCECVKGYKMEKDKCVEDKKTTGSNAFSTFILAILAILFFLF